MIIDKEKIEKLLCETFCTNIHLRKVKGKDDTFFVETPFMFPDGDTYTIYLKGIVGGFRITDLAHTFMQLSYDYNTDIFRSGTRAKLLEEIYTEFDITENDGEIFLEIPSNELSSGIFRMGQALTRITDLTYLDRDRTDSTFYEDLYDAIISIVPEEIVKKDYNVPEIPNTLNYTVDFRVEGKERDLFIFGVPNREKAKLTTICLQQFELNKVPFESLIVFADQSSIHRGDLARLTDAAGEQISSLDSSNELRRKIGRKSEILTFPTRLLIP